MSTDDAEARAAELLQQLGLKEYEARCFVGLTRVPSGTAKQLGEITDVPRTRVYDAVRVLEAQGLVEVQHSSPQQFRAVSLSEATETLRSQYEQRVDRLEDALTDVERVEEDDEESVQEVWAISSSTAVDNRARQLVQRATEEVVFVLGHESLLTDDLVETLTSCEEGIELVIGAADESLSRRVHEAVPRATTFVSGLGWLDADTDEGISVGRLLLVDRENILLSTIDPTVGDEHAVFGRGFRNGLVVVTRRLMAQGLLPERDPDDGE